MPVNDTHQVGMGFKQVSVLLLSISLLLLLSFIIYGSVLGWESLDAGISAGLWVPIDIPEFHISTSRNFF